MGCLEHAYQRKRLQLPQCQPRIEARQHTRLDMQFEIKEGLVIRATEDLKQRQLHEPRTFC